MELTAWRTFVTACQLGSLSAAAAELGYTQSAVSRQIAGLERRLGTPLIQRHARGVRPTPAGEVFQHHARITLMESDRALNAVRDIRDGTLRRPLAIGATPALAAGIVPKAIRRLLDEAGPLRWSLSPGLSAQLHDQVIAGDLDVAVITDAPPGLPNDPRVERRFLGLDEMVVVLPVDHPQAGRGPVHIRTLAGQAWVEDNDGSAALLRQHAARAGVATRIDLTAADLPGKIALVATGHAIALIPGILTCALRTDVTTVTLVDPPTRGIYMITPRRDPHPSATALGDQLVVAFGPRRPAPLASPAEPAGTVLAADGGHPHAVGDASRWDDPV
ncbi:LysR family transcriptional regulator [Verrucosispora sp. CWR15]|uniref:LysR family transcriptional regulator n=2 Tax=Verrucosispora sioxanthis TaxID=2499994 RepID=A0A6M1L4I4_9ACTN|nr:LysR family transcriptional regulator [Verrucosispora sioxanthis]NGM14087.1 LysR family transcriptional regulator [Verrucosispora sioxanthis]